jgi:hypothetical protein
MQAPVQTRVSLQPYSLQELTIASRRLAVRPASHAGIRFDAAVPAGTHVEIEYLRYKRLLARERRPLAAGTDAVDIKTHPRATHIRCYLSTGGRPPFRIGISVTCENRIEPIERYFIVIGAMKSGTTTLFNMLSRHPGLCRTWVEVPDRSFTKEINYFNELYRRSHTPIYYDWRFPFDAAKHAWTLDVSPNYAKLPGTRPVPRRIARLGGQTRLAYILRDPVDRIESQLAHAMQHHDTLRSMRHCKRLSRYARHLDRFTEHIPRENMLLLDFEQLRQRPDLLMAQVCDFLGIDKIPAPARIENRRKINFKLSEAQRAELLDTLRPDVQRLISEYGFSPAEKWLCESRAPWIRLPKFKR